MRTNHVQEPLKAINTHMLNAILSGIYLKPISISSAMIMRSVPLAESDKFKLKHIINTPDQIFPKSLVGGMSGRHISEIIKTAYDSAGVYKTDIKGFFRNVKKPHLKKSLSYAAKKLVLSVVSEALFAYKYTDDDKAVLEPVIVAYSPSKLTFSEHVNTGKYVPASLSDDAIITILGKIKNSHTGHDLICGGLIGYIIGEAARFNDINLALDLGINTTEIYKTLLSLVLVTDYGIVDPDAAAIMLLNKCELSDTARALMQDILKDIIFKLNVYTRDIMLGFILAQNRYDNKYNSSTSYIRNAVVKQCNNLSDIGMVSAVIDYETPTEPEKYVLFNNALPDHLDKLNAGVICPTYSHSPSYIISPGEIQNIYKYRNDSDVRNAEIINAARHWTMSEIVSQAIPVLAIENGNLFKSGLYNTNLQIKFSEKAFILHNKYHETLKSIFGKLSLNLTDNAHVLGKIQEKANLAFKNYIAVSDLNQTEPVTSLQAGTYKYDYKGVQRYALAGMRYPAIDIAVNPIRRSSLINYVRHLSCLDTFLDEDDRAISVRRRQFGVITDIKQAQQVLDSAIAYKYASDFDYTRLLGQAFGLEAACNEALLSQTLDTADCGPNSNTVLIYDPLSEELKTAIIAPFVAGYMAALCEFDAKYVDKCDYVIDLNKYVYKLYLDDTPGTEIRLINALRSGNGQLKPDYILLPYLGKMLKIAVTDEMLLENKINFRHIINSNNYEIISDDRRTTWHSNQITKAIDLAYDYTLDYYLTANNSLPEGGVTSPLMANYVLAEIMDDINAKITALNGQAFAYVDDISIIFKDALPDNCKRELTNIIASAMRKKGLCISADKTKLIKGKYKRELFGVTFLKYTGPEPVTSIRLTRPDHMKLRQKVHNAIKFVNAYLNNLKTNRTLVPDDAYIAANYPKDYDRRSHMKLPRILNKINGQLSWAMSLAPERYAPMKNKLKTHAISVMKEQIMPLIKEITAGFIDLASMANKQGMDEVEQMEEI